MKKRKSKAENIAARQAASRQLHPKYKEFQPTFVDESYVFIKNQAERMTALKAQYRKVAKQADQRLVRLEQLADKTGKDNVLKFAYSAAMYDIKNYFGENATRFNRKLDESLTEAKIERMLNTVVNFLNMPTSTKRGLMTVEEKKKKTFEENFSGLKWEDQIHIFERGILTKYSRLDSDVILKTIKVQGADKKKFDEFIKQETGKDFKTPKDAEDLIKYVDNAISQGKLNESILTKYLNANL